MAKKIGFLIFGTIFGFALSRVGASEFDAIYDMFTGSDLKLVGVIITAIVTGFAGMQLLHIKKTVRNGEKLNVSHKKLGKWSLAGAAVFGIGWGLSGACPGTVLAQIGEGKVFALTTFLGMVLGTYIYALLKQHRPEL